MTKRTLKQNFVVWKGNDIVPCFYDWFRKNPYVFTGCLNLTARRKLGMEERFYTNALENMHKSENKYLSENNVGSEV